MVVVGKGMKWCSRQGVFLESEILKQRLACQKFKNRFQDHYIIEGKERQ